ncbi:hypothetical protein PLESTB_001619300 [Pleodorina starrii]|uniref:Uncharacterized protein n=1 Tax=Pleodorina starrii TaxID=330485 RepID=A0A9W6BZ28_9CHLO|nr:hypothetical protein PLESTB_001619300 [Pleodorina starrii]GLC77259.1 hypothetical protein PLESTF_001905500 [Pleodorina starrii]
MRAVVEQPGVGSDSAVHSGPAAAVRAAGSLPSGRQQAQLMRKTAAAAAAAKATGSKLVSEDTGPAEGVPQVLQQQEQPQPQGLPQGLQPLSPAGHCHGPGPGGTPRYGSRSPSPPSHHARQY